jgi:hypothetical protein
MLDYVQQKKEEDSENCLAEEVGRCHEVQGWYDCLHEKEDLDALYVGFCLLGGRNYCRAEAHWDDIINQRMHFIRW